MLRPTCLLIIPFLLLGTFLFAQDRTITGKVVSAKDTVGLAGVSITVKGRTTGTSTASDGSFSIVAPPGRVLLQVSSVGFISKEQVVAANQNDIVIDLTEGSTELSEVVVTALGIQRQAKTLVYATQTVKPSELTEARDPNNVLNSLQGKVANALITQGSGGPGSGARIVLRGNRSIQGSRNALIVVDGVPIKNTTAGTAGSDFGSIQSSDGASNINPDDIESVTVLRGASAAALYGSQAGNGVIVITTKKGTKDRISVTLNLGVTAEAAWSLPKVQNLYGQGNGGVFQDTLTSGESWGAKMAGQSYVNFLGEQRTYSPQPDNIKDFFRTGISTNNSIGVSGGSEKMQTYLSYTYSNVQGIIPGNDLQRHNVNLRITNKIRKQVSTGTVLWAKSGGDYQKQNIINTDKWFDAMLEGNNKITTDLKINYRVGTIYQDSKFDATYEAANGLNITNKFSMNFAKSPSVNGSFSEVQTQSVFGQINLSFKDAIFLDASLRNDRDSRLPSPHTFQYPSVGVSAVISDLTTLPKSLSYLKASINYAEVGNGGQFGLLNPVYYYSQGAGNGFLQRSPTLPLPALKPEIVRNIEGGLEARFMNNRLGFMATYYKSNSFNQLLQVSLPVATGYSSKYINAGNIQNKGFELVVSGFPVRNRDFSWEVALNLALNRSKVKELSNEVKIFYLGGGFGRSGTLVIEEGKAYGGLLAFKWGTDTKGTRLVTGAGKRALTAAQEFIGNFNPKETVGFTNTFGYKGFSLRVLIDGRVGGVIVSGTEMNLAFSGIPEATAQYREGGWSLGGVDATGQPVSATISAQDFWQIASGKRY